MAHLVHGLGRLVELRLPRHPAIRAQVNAVLQHEADALRQCVLLLLLVFGISGCGDGLEALHALKVLIHELDGFALVELATHGRQDLAQTLEVFGHVGVALVLTLVEQRLDALVEYGLAEEVEATEFADELHIAEHLLLAELLGRLVDDRVARRLVVVGSVVELVLTHGEQELAKGGNRVGRRGRVAAVGLLEVGHETVEALTQLGVESAVGGLVERLVEYEHDDALEHLGVAYGKLTEVHGQLVELLRRELVEQAAHLAKRLLVIVADDLLTVVRADVVCMVVVVVGCVGVGVGGGGGGAVGRRWRLASNCTRRYPCRYLERRDALDRRLRRRTTTTCYDRCLMMLIRLDDLLLLLLMILMLI